MSEAQYYLLDVTINTGGQAGIDLTGLIAKLNTVIDSYSDATKLLYKYKVTGEAKILAVFQVSNITGLERTVAGIVRHGNIDVVCKPVVPYETFAKNLGVEESLTAPSKYDITAKQIMWLEFDIQYHGKTMDELIAIWKEEATVALGAKAKGKQLDLFKIVGERKVHLFSASPDVDMDKMSFGLPLMKKNGENVTITSHKLQDLNDYAKNMSPDSCGLV